MHNDVCQRNGNAFGSRGLFRESIEIGWRFDDHHGLSLMLDYISNTGLANPNPGMETACATDIASNRIDGRPVGSARDGYQRARHLGGLALSQSRLATHIA